MNEVLVFSELPKFLNSLGPMNCTIAPKSLMNLLPSGERLANLRHFNPVDHGSELNLNSKRI